MFRFLVALSAVAAGGLLSASGPGDAQRLAAGLSDSDPEVRRASTAALKDRPDALPWVRRANRSNDENTARRAAAVIAPYEQDRQSLVPKALESCLASGHIDLVTEWHQWWEPRVEDQLWPVGPKAAKAGLDLHSKFCMPNRTADWGDLGKMLGRSASRPLAAHNGPCSSQYPVHDGKAWIIRTDRLDRAEPINQTIQFASVGGPIHRAGPEGGSILLALGPSRLGSIAGSFVACDGDVWYQSQNNEQPARTGVDAQCSVIVCRGKFTGNERLAGVLLLVTGDVDLTGTPIVWDCLIRATGEVHLRPDVDLRNSTVQGRCRLKSPYKFFELADVGLAVADDEEGLVVREAKPGTPFGECGLRKGDLIRAIDDAPAGPSEQLRKAVRRAMVRQGDCLLTVTRGDKNLDLPVFFPLPK